MENHQSAQQASTGKIELELSPEMAAVVKGLGISPSTKINSLEDLKVLARISTMAQQFAATSAVKPTDGPVTNQSWCTARSEQN